MAVSERGGISRTEPQILREDKKRNEKIHEIKLVQNPALTVRAHITRSCKN